MKIRMCGPALVAMFVFGSLSGTALAEEWLDNGAAIPSALPVDMEGTIRVSDDKAGAELECTVDGEGMVGPGETGEVDHFLVSTCKRIKGFCNESLTMNFQSLPWNLEIVEPDIVWVPVLSYIVRCFSGTIEDECTDSTHLLILLPLEDPIHLEFLNREEDAGTCSVGGAKSGLLVGLIFLLASEAGHLLQVS